MRGVAFERAETTFEVTAVAMKVGGAYV